MSSNIQRLGETLAARMSKTAKATAGIAVELATINDNMSMTPDSLQVAIPEGEYMHIQGDQLQAGDRVLLAWCGSEPVVIGAVTY